MSQASPHLIDLCAEFLERYYEDDIAATVQGDGSTVVLDWSDLFQYDRDLAEDYLTEPDTVRAALNDAVEQISLPVTMDEAVSVTMADLPESRTFYPGEFSPTDRAGDILAVSGEVSKITDTYSVLRTGAFACQRCETLNRVPQTDDTVQEPHECTGCGRDGPFALDHSQSDHEDVQVARLQTPADHQTKAGTVIDVRLRDRLTDRLTGGDEVTINGSVELEQPNTRENRFDPVVEAQSIEVEQSDVDDMDISQPERERIETLAAGAEGDPLELAAQSYAPKIRGYDHVKQALILALVGGSRVEYPDGDWDRGEFHVLLIGDPSTSKSKLIRRAEDVGWRAVGVSGKGSTTAGITATAVQDDFGDGQSYSLEAGAVVKASGGVLAVDELDDMPAEVRASLLEPMSTQQINVNKGGINTTLDARTAVVAAGNPEQGRFDRYDRLPEQFVFDPPLLQRFDLIFTFSDEPDPDEDAEIAGHILQSRDQAKSGEGDIINVPVEADILRKWIGLAKQQSPPPFASEEVETFLRDSFVDIRDMVDDDSVVPITFRSLEGMLRIAEAAAKFELSDTIELRHAKTAKRLVGQSLQDTGYDPEEGRFDADVIETGQTATQRDRVRAITTLIEEIAAEHDDGAPREAVLDAAEENGLDRQKAADEIDRLRDQGEVYTPQTDHYRVT